MHPACPSPPSQAAPPGVRAAHRSPFCWHTSACTCRTDGTGQGAYWAPAVQLASAANLGADGGGTHLPEVSDIKEVKGVEQLAVPQPELVVADLEEGADVLQAQELRGEGA